MKTNEQKRVCPEDEFYPIGDDWSVEVLWKEVPDPHKHKATIFKCKVILNHRDRECARSNHYSSLRNAIEMAEHFIKVGYVPKKIPKVLGDHGDVRGRERWMATHHDEQQTLL